VMPSSLSSGKGSSKRTPSSRVRKPPTRDDPIKLHDVQQPPTRSARDEARRQNVNSVGFSPRTGGGKTSPASKRPPKLSPEEQTAQNARKVAHMLGELRTKAESLGGEVPRTLYYDALVKFGFVGGTSEANDLGFTDAPDTVFERLDSNQNGFLSVEELEAGLKGIFKDKASRNVVEELLSVGNDVMRTSMAEMSQKLADKASRVIDLFKKWDVDGDGAINHAEFVKAMPMLGLATYTPSEVDALFAAFDPDGSGEITFRELYKMIRHNPEKITLPTKVILPKRVVPVLESGSLRAQVYSEFRKFDPSEHIHANQLLGRPMKGHDLNPSLTRD